MNLYPVNTSISLSTTFTAATGGAPVDPTDVILYVRDPTQTETTYKYSAAQVQKSGTGQYNYILTPSLSGTYTYRWQGTGVVQASSLDMVFVVQPTTLT